MDLFRDASKSSDTLGASNAKAAAASLQLANAATRGGGALGLLPSIIASLQTMGIGGTGGPGGFIGSILGGAFGPASTTPFTGNSGEVQAAFSQTDIGSSGFGSGIAYGQEDLGQFLHSGGLAGDMKDVRPVPSGVFEDAPKYHAGGLVAHQKHIAGLAANEVPAILMGGPKGVREEVLHADDPRHRDNLQPQVAKALFGQIPRYHTGGVAGLQPDVLAPASGARYLYADRPDAGSDGGAATLTRGGDTHIHVSVAMPAGGSRATAQQWGAEAGKHIQNSLRRSGAR
jgi:hypothetical protein